MIGVAYAHAVVVDTSAAVALVDETDSLHEDAVACLDGLNGSVVLCSVDVTAHESFTRLRYAHDLAAALSGYALLRGLRVIPFEGTDEATALDLVKKYTDKCLSFHDALCAAVMMRHQMFRVFSFDADFWTFGFEVLPGRTRSRR